MTDWRRVKSWALEVGATVDPAPLFVLGVPLEDLYPLEPLEDLEAAPWSDLQVRAALLEARARRVGVTGHVRPGGVRPAEEHRESGRWLRLDRGEVLRLRRGGYISRDPVRPRVRRVGAGSGAGAGMF